MGLLTSSRSHGDSCSSMRNRPPGDRHGRVDVPSRVGGQPTAAGVVGVVHAPAVERDGDHFGAMGDGVIDGHPGDRAIHPARTECVAAQRRAAVLAFTAQPGVVVTGFGHQFGGGEVEAGGPAGAAARDGDRRRSWCSPLVAGGVPAYCHVGGSVLGCCGKTCWYRSLAEAVPAPANSLVTLWPSIFPRAVV
jgi:hypothetical protein